jgi:hypothetical protein
MANDSFVNDLLKDLLRVHPRTTAANWDDVNEMLGETTGQGLRKLVNFLSMAISDLPSKVKKTNKKQIGERLNLVGQVLDRHVLEDNSYANYKRDLRKVLRGHFLSTQFTDKPAKIADKLRQQATKPFLESVGATEFDNRARMIARNQDLKKTRDARHKDQLDISQEFIEDLCNQLMKDASNKPHCVLLLMELCTGARFGEIVMASKFELMPEVPNKRKRTVKSDLPAPIEMQRVKQTGLLKKVVQVDEAGVDRPSSVIKPVLPYVPANELLMALANWRKKFGIAENAVGSYDTNTVQRFRAATNALLRSYIPGDYSTHILRAIYGVAAYDLFRPANMSENNFLREILGHDALDVSLSYNHVNIIPNSEADEDEEAEEE